MNRIVRVSLVATAVFTLAVVLRVPSCHESYWVDELHSAWAVQDAFVDVAARAESGHQQPIYFQMLWLWKQVVGGDEGALRLSSVLAISLACSVLVVGVAERTKSLWAGGAAGMFLALESNSIFFGTELRPYASVVLCAAIATWCFVGAWNSPSRRGRLFAWYGLVMAIVTAMFMQLTSLGVLLWLLIAAGIRIWRTERRERRTFRVLIPPMVLLVGLVSLEIWRITDTWNARENWGSFASARSLIQIWRLWPWGMAIILPAAAIVLGLIAERWWGRGERLLSRHAEVLWLMGIVLFTTFGFWGAAYFEVVPLWHRRYMIAALPMLAWCFGSGVHEGVRCWVSHSLRSHPRWIAPAAWLVMGLVMGFALGWLVNSQGTLKKIRGGRFQLVSRGEDWRWAVGHVRENAAAGVTVAVDPGLIEQAQWRSELVAGPDSLAPEVTQYLTYVVRGPYELLRDVRIVPVASTLEPLPRLYDENVSVIWLISRRSSRQLTSAVERCVREDQSGAVGANVHVSDVHAPDVKVWSFGGVSVARIGRKVN